MKKVLIAVVVLLSLLVGNLAKAQTVTVSRESVTFIANPNLPKAPAPGIPPGGNPILVESPKGKLPKTGDSFDRLTLLGWMSLFTAIFLFIDRKRKKTVAQNHKGYFEDKETLSQKMF